MLQLSKRLFLVLGIYSFLSLSLCQAWSSTSTLDGGGWRIRSGRVVVLQSSSSHNNNNNNVPYRSNVTTDEQQLIFQIQKCQHADLNPVSDIIMDSFYDTKTSWRRLLKLAELNRLQQNFPYVDTDLHQMFVAVLAAAQEQANDGDATNSERIVPTHPRTVIGFVDIDARPCRPEIKLPRPYLSDLAVHPHYRRKGVAQALIQACEDFCREIPRQELYIRVEETNHAAVEMYMTKLNYQSRGVEEITKEKKRVMTLHKELVIRNDESDRTDDTGTTDSRERVWTTSAAESVDTVQQSDDQEFVI